MATSMNGFRKQNAYAPMQYYGTGQQNAPTEYTPAIPSYGSGMSFPANLGKGQPSFDANFMNYGGFNGTDTMTNFLDTTKGFGTYGEPSMMDSFKSWYGDNKGMLMGEKGAPGLIPMGIGAVNSVMGIMNGFNANKNAKEALSHSKDVFAANYGNQMLAFNEALGQKKASSAGMGGMSRTDAETYGKQYAAANGVQAYKGA